MSTFGTGPSAELVKQLLLKPMRPSPELASAILAVKDLVCQLHADEVRGKIAAAAPLSAESAKDDLPIVIDALAHLCRDSADFFQTSLLGPAHAAAREGQNFSSAEVIGEYVLVRRSLYSHLTDYLARELTEVEAETLQSGMDAIVAAMIVSFSRQRESRLQLETNAMNEFLSGLAHEVRNEINGLLISLQVLELRGAEAEVTSPSALAKPDVQRVAVLLGEIKQSRTNIESTIAALSRVLEADRIGSVKVELRETALHPLMEGVARSAERIERGKRGGQAPSSMFTRIRVECPGDLMVRSDSDLLGTVLSNFIGNAVKYSDGPITFRATAVGAKTCRVSVIDSGPGMTEVQSQNVFKKYERGGRTDAGGVGLGLFIAHKAARLFGGRLAVESRLGAGCSFSVEWSWV